MERKWFFALVENSLLILDYGALKDAWKAYREKPFEAVRILAAADKGALVLPRAEAIDLAERYPHGVWLQSLNEHDVDGLLDELYPVWIHILLSGHEAGEEVEQEMCLFPVSTAANFNQQVICVNEWTFSWLE
jgi:hypothetical protein